MTNTELKDLVGYGAALASLADHVAKGFKLTDIGEVLAIVQKGPGVVAEAPAAYQEYLALDDAGRADIDAYVESVYTLSNPKLEHDVEALIQLAVHASKVVQAFKA